MAFIYLYANDNLIELIGLQDLSDDAYINNATVTVTVKDKSSGQSIEGETWPLTLKYVSGSNGNYSVILRDTLSVSLNQQLVAEITANAGADRQGFWDEVVIVRRRRTK